jgi:hypothetical protein
MDGLRFDALIQTLGSVADRRAMVRMLGGAAIGTLSLSHGAVDAKKKCKGGKKPCGKKCCPLGQVCRNGRCSSCPKRQFECPLGGCAKTLCGGQCCAVAETCVDNQCVPCPDLTDSCAGDGPRCNKGSGFCATSVDGGNVCVSAAHECSPCTSDEDCSDVDDFAICGTCNTCGGANKACFLPFPE